MNTEKQRQRRHDDARLTESGNARSEQLNTRGAYRVANQQSLVPEWIRTSKAQLVFRYELVRRVFSENHHRARARSTRWALFRV